MFKAGACWLELSPGSSHLAMSNDMLKGWVRLVRELWSCIDKSVVRESQY